MKAYSWPLMNQLINVNQICLNFFFTEKKGKSLITCTSKFTTWEVWLVCTSELQQHCHTTTVRFNI